MKDVERALDAVEKALGFAWRAKAYLMKLRARIEAIGDRRDHAV